MDVGADEFEQSLPLLQELVLGADFVGTARAFGALSPGPLGGGSLRRVWRGWDRARGEAPLGPSLGRGRLEEAPAQGRRFFSAWAAGC